MREKLYKIIFEHDTPAGRSFDIWLITFVLISVIIVMLETVEAYAASFSKIFLYLEWFFTIIFTIELMLRLYCSPKPFRYLFSFYGIVDVLAIIPTYISFLIPGAQSFLVIRSLRMLRIFRILKLHTYTRAGQILTDAMLASKAKIIVFLAVIISLVFIIGALMYLVEGKESGFTSLPKSVYWAIVTMTTVGYGDITPQSALGQIISSILMIIGYGVIAVPTGIISAEMAKGDYIKRCPHCDHRILETEASFCSRCGKQV